MLPLARASMALAEQPGAAVMLPGTLYAYGELCQQLEAELLARAPTRGQRSVVIRAGDSFGAAKNTSIDLHVARHLADPNPLDRRLSYTGPLDAPNAWAYLLDLARAFVAVEKRGGLPAQTRQHLEGHTLTGQQLLGGLQCAGGDLGLVATGERVACQQFNCTPNRFAGLFVPMLRGLAQMRYPYRMQDALNGRVLTALVGPSPQTPLHAATRGYTRLCGRRCRRSKPGV